jgi:hypothetical protein
VKLHQRVHTGSFCIAVMCVIKRSGTCVVCSYISVYILGSVHIVVCNKTFRDIGSVKLPQCVRTGEYPYCCDVCHKTFVMFSGKCRHIFSFLFWQLHISWVVVLTVNASIYVECITFCVLEWLATFSFVISFYFLVSFDRQYKP